MMKIPGKAGKFIHNACFSAGECYYKYFESVGLAWKQIGSMSTFKYFGADNNEKTFRCAAISA